VQVCFDGKQALQALKFALPDVIILDMVLPDCSGMDVLQNLQEKRQRSPDAGNASIPVVVVSSRGLPADIIKAKKAGASEYLTKPVSYLDLNQAVGKVLELSI
jgi:CheY-like chemotaxis protein